MTTAQLIALDQILFILVAAVWAAAGGVALTAARQPREAARRTFLAAAALCAAAIAVTALRVLVTVGLARAGWWFAAEKVTLALPLVVVPALASAVISLPRLLRPGPEPSARRVAFPLLVTAYGAAAGIVCGIAISYPVTAGGVVAVLVLFTAASALTWRLLAPGRPSAGRRSGGRWRLAGVSVLLVALIWAVSGSWSGGGHLHAGHDATAFGVPIDQLLGPSGKDARRFTLTAQPATVRLPSGRTVEAWSFNGQVPGPVLRVRQGDLVEVTLLNRLPGRPVTIHWHGYDVPGGEDGVPGVTQDAVKPGQSHVYRFRATDPGTYWYHSHQDSSLAVPRGLFGMLIVDPAQPLKEDHTVALHTFGDRLTMSVDGSAPTDERATASIPPGSPVRLRIVDTDSLPLTLGLSGVPYRIAAVDGGDVPGATDLTGQRLHLAAGGRYDLTFTMPSRPVLLSAEGHPGLLIKTPGPDAPAPDAASGPVVDITRYGSRVPVPGRFDQEVTWVLDKTLALVNGVPKLGYTVNGKAWPNIPTPLVRQGQTIKITVVNRGRDTHPMHPHGHHVQILSRDGVPANGLLMDTFDVAPGEVWEVALVADNPGIWMSHCHDLNHAAQGMEFHLAYEGITTPFDVSAGNHPA
ncbi:multicopper oxidase family protein [Planotetraspora sp. A-T 1434]|uniref:multicopper oxidase family protein n=1 Tax=Planotetraspora sp. A-T 1434 TaxID=2979219 RepID=UPI0021BE9A14|nr:multicopper oxidase family protein [Planotetraspora sp. A-T 1434]MCT9930502.1 multicopper oxidase family protein [Planotetraspora sp. A-T 1434]